MNTPMKEGGQDTVARTEKASFGIAAVRSVGTRGQPCRLRKADRTRAPEVFSGPLFRRIEFISTHSDRKGRAWPCRHPLAVSPKNPRLHSEPGNSRPGW